MRNLWSNPYKTVKSRNGYKIAIFGCFTKTFGCVLGVKKRKFEKNPKKSIFGKIFGIFRFSLLFLNISDETGLVLKIHTCHVTDPILYVLTNIMD